MKIRLSELKKIIKEAWTSADDARSAADDKTKDALRPKVEEMLRSIYVGGYRADGAPSLYDMLEDVKGGQAKRTVEAMLYSIVDMVEGK